jgi:hypothetical protein
MDTLSYLPCFFFFHMKKFIKQAKFLHISLLLLNEIGYHPRNFADSVFLFYVNVNDNK